MSSVHSAMIMAGGTGGHVYPGLAVARELRAAGWDVAWIGTSRGLESRVVPENDIVLYTLRTLGLRGKGFASKVKGVLSLVYACWQALLLLIRQRPSIVIGFGGYAAGPAGAVAKLLGIPVLIHEQNAVAGTTNRLLARFANKVLAGFEGAFTGRPDVLVTGNPVRLELTQHEPKSYPRQPFDSEHRLKLAILGGSQGAMALNEAVPQAIAQLPESMRELIDVRHQCGRDHLASASSAWSSVSEVTVDVMPYVEDMSALYSWADVAICRAGALTVSELAVTGTPALLIPLPMAIDNHQLRNAEALQNAGGARVLLQSDVGSGELEAFLESVLSSAKHLQEMSDSARAWSKPNATEHVVAIARELVNV